MNRLPTLFISHGSPMLAIDDSPARRFLQRLGKMLPRPKAIAMVSAHWESIGGPSVSLAVRPATIHDFGGFPQALFDIQYPARGAPDVAHRAAMLLESAGFAVKRSPDRGLDHGAWVPLSLMYPDADLPIFQISLMRDASPSEHVRMGKALGDLRDDGILIIGSGALTHNLHALRGHAIDAHVPDWVSEFGTWIKARLEGAQHDALQAYRTLAPSAVRNHPSEEHLLPLFVALGAAGDAPTVQQLHASHEYGVLAMDVYAFTPTV